VKSCGLVKSCSDAEFSVNWKRRGSMKEQEFVEIFKANGGKSRRLFSETENSDDA